MLLDAHTLLVVAMLANGSVAIANVLVWSQDRPEAAPLWMAAATTLCCVSAVLRDTLPDAAAIVMANALLSLGTGCVATACRSLGGRTPSTFGLAAPPLVWIAACAMPAFMADQQLRVATSSATCALIMAWATLELGRDRRDRLAARYGLMSVLAINGIAAAIRMVGAMSPTGSLPRAGVARTSDLTLTTFWSVGFLLLAGLGVILFVKERAERRLLRVVGQDPLTGIANRRRFDEALDAAFIRAAGYGQPLSLIMIDADAFKPFNDLHGHAQGDLALRAIAAVLTASTLGRGGLAARYGGEEFIVLLPGTDRAGALRVANEVRDGVRGLHILHPGSGHGRLTVSVGCSSSDPVSGVLASDLLLSADRALYAAKHAGRDQVRWTGCPDPSRRQGHRDPPVAIGNAVNGYSVWEKPPPRLHEIEAILPPRLPVAPTASTIRSRIGAFPAS